MPDLTPEKLAELRLAALIEGHDAAHYPTSVVVPTRTLLVDYTVCGHCYDVGDGAHPYAYEEGGLQDVAHPCATRRALDFTEATA